ncbi:hypothetical protein MAP00_008392 [Monascus purpureus]|nr:hypothetical protein MAP00_008392 [Monascus purpureus]
MLTVYYIDRQTGIIRRDMDITAYLDGDGDSNEVIIASRDSHRNTTRHDRITKSPSKVPLLFHPDVNIMNSPFRYVSVVAPGSTAANASRSAFKFDVANGTFIR